jgi:DNA-binding transcriptional ArsR family regulator
MQSSAPRLTSDETLVFMSAARAGLAAGGPEDDDPADAVLRALADPHRRRILRLVRGGELAAGEIAANFEATQQAVSHHLQVLAKAGLLSERRDGARRLYALDPHALDPVREMLSELWPSALERLKYVVEQDQQQKKAKPRKAGRKP